MIMALKLIFILACALTSWGLLATLAAALIATEALPDATAFTILSLFAAVCAYVATGLFSR